uniref:Serine/threonine-protein kinase BSK1-like TPR repeats domain-containing protein n=1 Tax=Physcomitrium patens TaxID=3218 RepID=A0A7I4DT92_PHYPA
MGWVNGNVPRGTRLVRVYQKLLSAARDGNVQAFKDVARTVDDGSGLRQALSAVKDGNGRDTPLIHAARQGHTSFSLYLLEHGADACATPSENQPSVLHHAAGTGLGCKGVDVDSPSDAGSPLIWAAGHDHPKAVKVLLESGANPNAATDDDVTALVTAAAAGITESVELLLKNGANINASAMGGVTPLHVAADHGNERMVDCLLAAGANPDAVDDDKAKPIFAAKESRSVVEKLLPITTLDPAIKDWTVDGVLSHAQKLAAEEEAEYRRLKEADEKAKTAQANGRMKIEVSAEMKKKAAEAKARGDEAFKKQDFMLAVDAYTQARHFDPTNAVSLSNRSVCWIRSGQPEQALADAKVARALDPEWSKPCFREGSALLLLQRFDEAADAFYCGVNLIPAIRR